MLSAISKVSTLRSCTKYLTKCSYHASARLFAVNTFSMPAMSPTMEKGGIVSWKYKVGEPFNAGDVILEVETDKSQIDVEALDDGKFAKILRDEGAKDVDVGEPIAYIADVDDDLATIKLPQEVNTKKPKPSGNKKPSSPAKYEPAMQQQKKNAATVTTVANGSQANPEQTFLPSVSLLLAENGISKQKALKEITPSGSNGRLLKGDVLAYLGTIPQDSVTKITEFIKKNERLDLSNIERIELKPKESEHAQQEVAHKLEVTPVQFEEQVVFHAPASVPPEKLRESLNSFLKEAFQFTHEAPLTDTNSKHYDPIFEDLVTLSPREPRFKFSYDLIQIPKTNDIQGMYGKEDIFDLLTSPDTSVSPGKSVDRGSSSDKNEYLLTLNVSVNNKGFNDAEVKAVRFVDYVRELESF
ncbi:pdx1p [Saccharomyces arboricola H-6]|uniref:Dihydrolipoamide dehydrogenase-binding protein of pyruvate dehydrogenase complex n=1 Tax=Saccharomyces arboricola (strain H-6 / AS 2.3317 / CBS 10644) TaxID=1160507 RepID=J8Q4M8_SACAR|nr:pdx1p [Saccharomyces arboricola H-6]